MCGKIGAGVGLRVKFRVKRRRRRGRWWCLVRGLGGEAAGFLVVGGGDGFSVMIVILVVLVFLL